MGDVMDWMFPEIAYADNHSDSSVIENVSQDISEEMLEEEKKQLDSERAALLEEKSELKKTIDEYRDSIKIADNAAIALRNYVESLDAELVKLLMSCVVAVSERIIREKISDSPEILTQIVNDIRSSLSPDEKIISIRISNDNKSCISYLSNELAALCREDASLCSGDVVVESNYSFVISNLRSRIEGLLRDNNYA